MEEVHNVFDREDISKQRDFLVHILEDEPPYKQNKFEYEWYCYFGLIENICIDSYCEACGGEKVFSTEIKDELQEIHTDSFKVSGGFPGTKRYTVEEVFKDKIYSVNLTLKCAKCGERHYYSLLFVDNKVMKIGQYPSFAKQSEHELVKYKNVVSKYYIELIRSVNAYSQHMGIASFVYLRRILEHIVETEYVKFKDKTEKNCVSFDEKMKLVDKEINIIPKEIDAQKSKIYSVLSKGIHEYEEEECYELYPYMKALILIILDKYVYEKERSKQLKEISKLLEGR